MNHKTTIWKSCLLCFLTALMVVGLVACKNANSEDPTDPPIQVNPEQDETEPATQPSVVQDYDNGVVRGETVVENVILFNDFSTTLDENITQEWQKSCFKGSKATLEDGWAHVTSSEHLFVFGYSSWGAFGNVKFETGKTYTVSFDLRKGSDNSNNNFTLTLAEEKPNEDPRFGKQLKQVVLDFSDIENLVAFNSEKGEFAHVTYDAETGICHLEVRFSVERGSNYYLLNSRDTSGYNDWFIDNLYIAQITEEGRSVEWIQEDNKPTYDYSVNEEKIGSYQLNRFLLGTSFSRPQGAKIELTNNARNAFFGPTSVTADEGWARITSDRHMFTFGRFDTWGSVFGGVDFYDGHSYVMNFKLKLGDARTKTVFNLYVQQEDNQDVREGTALRTLTLDFADLYREAEEGESNYFVKENTDDFASVVYDSETRIAHVEIRFKKNVTPNIQVVSKVSGDNEWLIDQLNIMDVTPKVTIEKIDYDNGVRFDNYDTKAVVFENDFSESVDKDVDAEWERTAYFGSEAELVDGMASITSNEGLFAYGTHRWGMFGAVSFGKGLTYKMSFDLRLADDNNNRKFALYLMEDNGHIYQEGKALKELLIDFSDYKKLVLKNTDNFASVQYDKETNMTHIEILFTAPENGNVEVVSFKRGYNHFYMDNLRVEQVGIHCESHVDENGDASCDICEAPIVQEKDYDNGVVINVIDVNTLFENDFSQDVNKGITQEWHKKAFFGSNAELSNGWARIVSNEHLFVYGYHTWGYYGGFGFEKGSYYTAEFDLKLGADNTNRVFNLYVTTEIPDADVRAGKAERTLTLNFADFGNFVTTNTDDFAHVTYDASTHTAHIKVVFRADSEVFTQLLAKCPGNNDWLMDNLLIKKVRINCTEHIDVDSDGACDVCGAMQVVEKDYDNGVVIDVTDVAVKLENDFSADLNKGVDANWKRTAFFSSTAVLDNGRARVTSQDGLFIYGNHAWGQYGGVGFTKGSYYTVELDIMLGADNANRVLNLYVTKQNDSDAYGGTPYKTLTLNFADFKNFVTTNTDDFAHVTYNAATHTAHVKLLFQADANVDTQLICRSVGANDWLFDNLCIKQVKTTVFEQNYDNGVVIDVTDVAVKLKNDFSADLNKGVDANWKRTAFFQTKTAALDNGWARITSENGLFVYGNHAWGQYGGVGFTKGKYFTVELDIKLGDAGSNKILNLYVTKQNDSDAYGGTPYKTLTLNFADTKNFVTTNTDNFAYVTYDAATHTAHVKMLFRADANVDTQLICRSVGANDWLFDNLCVKEVKPNN